MPNVLYVSIAFPPKSDAECLQSAKYFHHLQQDKSLSIEVVTSAIPTLYMKRDATLERYAHGFTNQVSVQLRENRWVNFLRSRLGLGEATFPDSKQSFHRQSEAVLKRIRRRPDVIYSRSFPLSSTLLACKLQRHYGVPWVMHLSDPWADAPLHGWSKRYNQRQRAVELQCMEAARYVCLTSTQTVDFYAAKYPHLKEKFLFFPNVFEVGQPRERVARFDGILADDKLKIVFTGGMASGRSPRFMLEPLRQLIAAKPQLRDRVVAVFAGEADRRNRMVFNEYASLPVHYLGKVPFGDAQYLQEQADVLLLIDTPVQDQGRAMYFPSKLIDYMSVGKRILAIASRGSVTDLAMKGRVGDSVEHADQRQIATLIEEAIVAFCEGRRDYFSASAGPPLEFEAGYNASRLAELLKSVAAGVPAPSAVAA